jgi:hypothetical protein
MSICTVAVDHIVWPSDATLPDREDEEEAGLDHTIFLYDILRRTYVTAKSGRSASLLAELMPGEIFFLIMLLARDCNF